MVRFHGNKLTNVHGACDGEGELSFGGFYRAKGRISGCARHIQPGEKIYRSDLRENKCGEHHVNKCHRGNYTRPAQSLINIFRSWGRLQWRDFLIRSTVNTVASLSVVFTIYCLYHAYSEKANLGISLVSTACSELLGHMAFFDYPNLSSVDQARWEEWLHGTYDCPKAVVSMHTLNTHPSCSCD